MTTPVIFRADKFGEHKGEVTAVFPAEPAFVMSYEMTCYAHYGQHGSCSDEWYADKTRPATPDEYAPLLRELVSVGYDGSEDLPEDYARFA